MDEQKAEQEKRDEYCRGLRAIAGFLEENLEVPVPNTDSLGLHTYSKEILANVARSSGKWEKKFTDYYFSLSRQFHGFKLFYQCERSMICERKVVGTKLIPKHTNEEHFEDIVEWDCKDALLKPSEE